MIKFTFLLLLTVPLFAQKPDYTRDVKMTPFVLNSAQTYFTPRFPFKFVAAAGATADGSPPTWLSYDSGFIFGRKKTTNSVDPGNTFSVLTIQQDSLYNIGTPWALTVVNRSNIQTSYGSTGIMARLDKLDQSSDVGFGSHGETNCYNCAGTGVGINGEAWLYGNTIKTPELIGVNGQSGILSPGTSSITHTVKGGQFQVHWPATGRNTEGGVNIVPVSGNHTYGLKITQNVAHGNQWTYGIDVDGDVRLRAGRFLTFEQSSTDMSLLAGVKFFIDGILFNTIGVNNTGDMLITRGIRGGGHIFIDGNSKFKVNIASGGSPTDAGVEFQTDGTVRNHIGLTDSTVLVANKGMAFGLSTLAGVPGISGTVPPGAHLYCTDCDTPISSGANCTAAGDHAGALMVFIRGNWKCF